MNLRSHLALILPALMLGWGAAAWQGAPAKDPTAQQTSPNSQQAAPNAKQPAATQATPQEELTGLPRGKKLMLKDGSFQLVRSYEQNGDRVRYYSVERGQWEVIPEALVDWDATKKAEAAQDKTAAALLEKVHIQETAARAETPVDVDASLLVAPGVFLPDGEGMFALEGKAVKRLGQVSAQDKTDKKTVLKQILSPIPIVPSKKNIEIPGSEPRYESRRRLPSSICAKRRRGPR